ncbi:MAG: hypothetical protein ACRDNK_00470 [Solirubrobacteraceae bacterium]
MPVAVRLVVVQGPVQALTACAAVHHAEQLWQPGYRNVMLFGGILADDRSSHVRVVRAATLDCARAIDWEAVLDFVDLPDTASLQAALAPYGEVAEIVCGRNRQLVNEVSLAAFPDARRITVGDGFGVLDIDPDPIWPQFDLAMPLLPTTLRPNTLGRTELIITPREAMLAMIAALRAGAPGLLEADTELAEFASGGILMLMNYLTEAYSATLRGEIGLAVHMARSAAGSPHQPVVIKPHPRSSLGQTAALARRLRADGHPVRIMGQYEFGQYPIEAFEALARSVETIHVQGSSSAFSLRYLYGVKPTVALPSRQARRALLPRDFTRVATGVKEAKRFLDALDAWDGRTPMPFALQLKTPIRAKVLGRLTRPITWNPIGNLKRHPRQWQDPGLPAALAQHLGTATPQRRADREHGIVWLSSDLAPAEPTPAAAQAVTGFLARASGRPETVTAALVAVAPSTHAPGWLGWWRRLAGIRVIENARLSGEEFEDLLETGADVLLRVPEVGRTIRAQLGERVRGTRALPDGYAGFVFRVRPPATAPGPAPDRAARSGPSVALPSQ